MQAQISLLIDEQPGSLFRVVTALRRFGFRFQDEDLLASPVDDGYTVDLRVDGATRPTGELTGQLEALQGVTRVRDVRRLLPPGHAITGDSLIPDVDESPLEPDSETRRRRQTALRLDRVVDAYPAIAGPVLDYIDSVGDDRDALVRNFGLRFGRRMAATEPRFQDVTTIEDALDRVLRGFLFPITRPEVHGRTLVCGASLFDPSDDSTHPRPERATRLAVCAFLEGLIEGMLNHAPHLNEIKVRHTACRHRGHRTCVYEVDVAAE